MSCWPLDDFEAIDLKMLFPKWFIEFPYTLSINVESLWNFHTFFNSNTSPEQILSFPNNNFAFFHSWQIGYFKTQSTDSNNHMFFLLEIKAETYKKKDLKDK